jgi:branched-chain amino acid transport system ATP-binding protein
MGTLLRLSNVAKNFGALKVVDDLTFDVAEGEALGILGPNGAGKTTMFSLVAGELRPTAGSIHFLDRDITNLPAHARCRLGVGRTYQIPRPFGDMTVFENLLVGAAFGAGRREADCYDLCVGVLDRTGLLGKANSPARSLTLLERKRLELSRALATMPKVLLLDEIAGGLTESECGELIRTIKAVHAAGTTIVWIEHVVHALLAVVGRLVVINFGQKLDDGRPDAVLRNPAVQDVYMGMTAA